MKPDSPTNFADDLTTEAWKYGFRWGPLVVERTAHIEGRGYVVTVRTERESVQVFVSEKGRNLRTYPVRDFP